MREREGGDEDLAIIYIHYHYSICWLQSSSYAPQPPPRGPPGFWQFLAEPDFSMDEYTRVGRMSSMMGGVYNMKRWTEVFGPMGPIESWQEDLHRCTQFDTPPSPKVIQNVFGERVFDGLRQKKQDNLQFRKGYLSWVDAASRGSDEGVVWVPSWDFSCAAMRCTSQSNIPGWWYPALIVAYDDGAGLCYIFECPKIAWAGSRLWLAHADRVILFQQQGVGGNVTKGPKGEDKSDKFDDGAVGGSKDVGGQHTKGPKGEGKSDKFDDGAVGAAPIVEGKVVDQVGGKVTKGQSGQHAKGPTGEGKSDKFDDGAVGAAPSVEGKVVDQVVEKGLQLKGEDVWQRRLLARKRKDESLRQLKLKDESLRQLKLKDESQLEEF